MGLIRMVSIRKKALQNVEIAQERHKDYYNVKHCMDKGKYKVGVVVLLMNSKKLSRRGLILDPNLTGPYRIHVLSKGTFRFCKAKDSTKFSQLYIIRLG